MTLASVSGCAVWNLCRRNQDKFCCNAGLGWMMTFLFISLKKLKGASLWHLREVRERTCFVLLIFPLKYMLLTLWKGLPPFLPYMTWLYVIPNSLCNLEMLGSRLKYLPEWYISQFNKNWFRWFICIHSFTHSAVFFKKNELFGCNFLVMRAKRNHPFSGSAYDYESGGIYKKLWRFNYLYII